MKNGDRVTIHLSYRPDVGVLGEWPWATAVELDERGGTFRLENFLLMTPLVVGDLVRCELGSDSRYHVVEITALMPGVLLALTLPDDAQATVNTLAQDLAAAGFKLNRAGAAYLQVWADIEPSGLTASLLAREWPDDWEIVERLDVVGRIVQIDAAVDPVPLPTTVEPARDTGYRAAEDPEWLRCGVSDPATLARVQELAASDPRVRATIDAGRHADVLEYVKRLAVRDLRELPPITRPLLIDPPHE